MNIIRFAVLAMVFGFTGVVSPVTATTALGVCTLTGGEIAGCIEITGTVVGGGLKINGSAVLQGTASD